MKGSELIDHEMMINIGLIMKQYNCDVGIYFELVRRPSVPNVWQACQDAQETNLPVLYSISIFWLCKLTRKLRVSIFARRVFKDDIRGSQVSQDPG